MRRRVNVLTMDDITRGMKRTDMRTDKEKMRNVEKMRKEKRKRAMMEAREKRKKEDPEKAREMQRKFDTEMGGQTGGAPIGLLKF